MKFTAKDYRNLKNSLEKLITEKDVDFKATKRHYIEQHIGIEPAKRFVWDMLWASKFTISYRYSMDYQYVDTHLYTATKRAIDELIAER